MARRRARAHHAHSLQVGRVICVNCSWEGCSNEWCDGVLARITRTLCRSVAACWLPRRLHLAWLERLLQRHALP